MVSLPISASSIPSQNLHRRRVDATPLKSSRPSPDTSKVGEGTSYGEVDLDEVIEILKFDLTTITIEEISVLQEAPARKKHQELLRREHKQRKVLHDIKEIFLNAFILLTPNEEKSIIEKLVNIVSKISDADLDTNTKLLEWSENFFQTKVNKNISTAIALRQVELATKIEDVKKILENIFSLHINLFDVNLFT